MFEQLQNIFPSIISYKNFHKKKANEEDYKWFQLEQNQVIGILKHELTDKDLTLLSTFLTPFQTSFPLLTEQEKNWKQKIEAGEESGSVDKTNHPFRFVYFSIRKDQIDPKTFKESLHEFFSYPVPILWENEREGIIIEEKAKYEDESISYKQIIDVLMSDLYVNIHFFAGPYVQHLNNTGKHYRSLLTSARTAFNYSDKSVLSFSESIPFLLVDQTSESFREELSSSVLQEFSEDEEILQTVETFIKCNLNVSVAAKTLYMHRNSLQYRLDKFIEKTGIDIRHFHEAITVYIALLANMHKG
ncbi:PucR family transcriptional regulator [Oceanobacillus manasiensis]|uniref:PucR family transcriptional regulator n=1 Tax=Oceanobacillus manasiensis TaxID=586413 RepID=UPI0005AA3959|nr:helix-turn-helix domain-containing protein [Oceanobacillus manasiensis]